MFIPSDLGANEIAFVKVVKTDAPKEPQDATLNAADSNEPTLTIEGASQDGDVLFVFKNKE